MPRGLTDDSIWCTSVDGGAGRASGRKEKKLITKINYSGVKNLYNQQIAYTFEFASFDSPDSGGWINFALK